MNIFINFSLFIKIYSKYWQKNNLFKTNLLNKYLVHLQNMNVFHVLAKYLQGKTRGFGTLGLRSL